MTTASNPIVLAPPLSASVLRMRSASSPMTATACWLSWRLRLAPSTHSTTGCASHSFGSRSSPPPRRRRSITHDPARGLAWRTSRRLSWRIMADAAKRAIPPPPPRGPGVLERGRRSRRSRRHHRMCGRHCGRDRGQHCGQAPSRHSRIGQGRLLIGRPSFDWRSDWRSGSSSQLIVGPQRRQHGRLAFHGSLVVGCSACDGHCGSGSLIDIGRNQARQGRHDHPAVRSGRGGGGTR